jgi:hypothetical protein
MITQSVLIPRDKFTYRQAVNWIRSHDYMVTYRGKPVDKTEKYWRFRQKDPSKKYRYRSHKLPNDIILILGYIK